MASKKLYSQRLTASEMRLVPPANGGPTPYPIEHNPHAAGYGNKRDSTPILQFADAAMKGQP